MDEQVARTRATTLTGTAVCAALPLAELGLDGRPLAGAYPFVYGFIGLAVGVLLFLAPRRFQILQRRYAGVIGSLLLLVLVFLKVVVGLQAVPASVVFLLGALTARLYIVGEESSRSARD